jgi:hypothetical protein
MGQFAVWHVKDDWYVGRPAGDRIENRQQLVTYLESKGATPADLGFDSDEDRAGFEAMLSAAAD